MKAIKWRSNNPIARQTFLMMPRWNDSMAGYSRLFFFWMVLTNHCAAAVPSVKNTFLILHPPGGSAAAKDRPRSDPIKGIGRIKRHICQIFFSFLLLKERKEFCKKWAARHARFCQIIWPERKKTTSAMMLSCIIQDGRRLECHCMFSFMFLVMCTEKRIITAAHILCECCAISSCVDVKWRKLRRRL